MTISLFGTAIDTTTKTGSTAESIKLTSLATELATETIKTLAAAEDQEAVKNLIAQSFTDNATMDSIVKSMLAGGYVTVTDNESTEEAVEKFNEKLVNDTVFLSELDKESAIKMLKSQQSKRSRVKNEVMIQANYIKSMSAAIAEALIRANCELPANGNRASGRRVELELTDEMIERYKNSQDLLTKAIRNIQSKKTIAKKKAGFDENSEDYQTLLNFEQSLKMLRTDKVHVVETIVEKLVVDPELEAKANKVDGVSSLLADLDLDKMKKGDLAKIIAEAKEMLLADMRGI